jgi:hypothetical protein
VPVRVKTLNAQQLREQEAKIFRVLEVYEQYATYWFTCTVDENQTEPACKLHIYTSGEQVDESFTYINTVHALCDEHYFLEIL